MDNYYEKYIKYKSKYEHLKNQIGGGKQSALDLFLARFDEVSKDISLSGLTKLKTINGKPYS
jgi:uncharacterized FAD-dependent dehydrogenase